MGTPAAIEVSALERRVFVGMVIADAFVSTVLVVYVEIFPSDRQAASLIWGALLFAATVTYWTVRRREIRRLRSGTLSTPASPQHGESAGTTE
jgi:hypothetical protein